MHRYDHSCGSQKDGASCYLETRERNREDASGHSHGASRDDAYFPHGEGDEGEGVGRGDGESTGAVFY